jgi:hypothetical protein
MKFLRNKFTRRFTCTFFLAVFLMNIFAPSVSYALTSGPHQPEYTSYEDAASTDMVNLLTGDFNLNIPVMTVPVGGDGGFAVPLSYHAGIGPEQESSWVGLGWNLNVGSLTRNINGFPDDASGETQKINVKDLTGRRGWYSNFVWTMGWDSQVGHYGSVSLLGLNANWNSEGTNVGIAGISVGRDGGINAEQLGITLLVASAIFLSPLAAELSSISMGEAVAFDLGMSALMTAGNGFSGPGASSIDGYWKYSRQTESKLLGLYKNYWMWLDQTRDEAMYGTLNLHRSPSSILPDGSLNAKVRIKVDGGSAVTPQRFNMTNNSTTNTGAASDVNMDFSATPKFYDNNSPTLLAYDSYYVNGPGISGSIKPYRLETGSVSVPREMSEYHVRLNPLPFLDYGANKVPFVYEGALGNKYFHHVGNVSSSTVSSPSFYFGLNTSLSTTSGYNNNNVINHELDDRIFSAERIRSDIAARQKLPQGNFVDWLTNAEIKNTSGKFTNSAYMDYFSGSNRQAFRNSYSFGGRRTYYGVSASNGVIALSAGQDVSKISPLNKVDVIVMNDSRDSNGNIVYSSSTTYPNVTVNSISSSQLTVNNTSISITSTNGHIEIVSKNEPKGDNIIGGFVVTSAEGMNYHYALPVYDYDFYSKTTKISDPNVNSTITRSAQFANTWLLTAITGPDFVDRGGTGNAGDGIIDSNDWGYWIKFNYGNYCSDYKWRMPYKDALLTTSDNSYTTFSEGFKEKYYLNSIESRSHVALFIKDARNDAKDASDIKKSSLRLGEIALITREVYDQLINPAGSYQLKNCSGVIDVVYQNNGINNTGANINGAISTFVRANALKRVVFNTGYSLCPGVLNSDPGYGKLTLNSISMFTRNDVKILPDYKFTYGNNSPYDVNKWDGWGMYSANGTSTGLSHKASSIDTDGLSWSLASITSPLGNTVNVSYERDTYSSISGEPAYAVNASFDYDNAGAKTALQAGEITLTSAAGLAVDDLVEVSGTLEFYCTNTPQYGVLPYGPTTYQITSISGSTIKLNTSNYTGVPCLSTMYDVRSNIGTVKKIGKKGGNTRVKAITINDDWGQQYKTRYVYDDAGVSTGVVAQEPEYIRAGDSDYPFYAYLNYPATPVLYGKVSVLSGRLSDDNDFVSKQIFEFETPHKSQYSLTKTKIKDKVLISTYVNDKEYTSLVKHEIVNKTSKIGSVKSIKTLDKTGAVISQRSIVYTDPNTEPITNNGVNNYQGTFSEGTLMFDIIMEMQGSPTFAKTYYHKDQRTTMINYPYTVKKVIDNVNGRISETENKNWDPITGQVIETWNKTPLGLRTKTIMEPLYSVNGTGYNEFGSKAVNASNKNLLSQIGVTYAYRIDNNGNELGLISAVSSVWKKDWASYRILDGTNDYKDDADLTAGIPVWRKFETYAWKGDYSRMNLDGTHKFSSTDKFNFASPSLNGKWQKIGMIPRYNHNSIMLEAADGNDIYSSNKLGYRDQLTICTASNAMYTEIAYCGAEDLNMSTDYFGGEVKKGAGALNSAKAHTGSNSVTVTTGNSFIFKASSLKAAKRYRASVWTDSPDGRIYYKLNGNTNELLSGAPVVQKQVGNWYLLDFDIPVQSAIFSLEIGVKSATGLAVNFDDFRFQPSEASMVCYVYDKDTHDATYILGNDNLFIKYEYNGRGFISKTYQESIAFNGVKLLSESNSDYRRFHYDN